MCEIAYSISETWNSDKLNLGKGKIQIFSKTTYMDIQNIKFVIKLNSRKFSFKNYEKIFCGGRCFLKRRSVSTTVD